MIENFSIGIPCLYNDYMENRLYALLNSIKQDSWICDVPIVIYAQEFPDFELERLNSFNTKFKNMKVYTGPRVKIAPSIKLEVLKRSETEYIHIMDDDTIFKQSEAFITAYLNSVTTALKAFEEIPDLTCVTYHEAGSKSVPRNTLRIVFPARSCIGYGRIFSKSRVLGTDIEKYWTLTRNLEDCCFGGSIALSRKLYSDITLSPNFSNASNTGSAFRGKAFGVPLMRRMEEAYSMFSDFDTLFKDYLKLVEPLDSTDFYVEKSVSLANTGAWNLKKLGILKSRWEARKQLGLSDYDALAAELEELYSSFE